MHPYTTKTNTGVRQNTRGTQQRQELNHSLTPPINKLRKSHPSDSTEPPHTSRNNLLNKNKNTDLKPGTHQHKSEKPCSLARKQVGVITKIHPKRKPQFIRNIRQCQLVGSTITSRQKFKNMEHSNPASAYKARDRYSSFRPTNI